MSAAILLTLVATLLSATSTAVQRERLADAQSDLRETLRPGQRAVEALLRSYVDQQSGQRGYLLTGDPQLLEPYYEGRNRTTQLETELAALSASPEFDRMRDAALGAGKRWQTEVAEPEIALRRDGPLPQGALVESVQRGKLLFDDLRAKVGNFSAHLAILVAVQLDRFNTAQSFADRAAIATAVMVLLAALLGLTSLQILLARPLRRLVRKVRAVADGEYAIPIEAHGPREVASMALAAEQMRLGILRYSGELVAAQQRLSVAVERDRLVAELQRGTVSRLSMLGISLSAVAARHPSAQADLVALIRETDEVLIGLRNAIYSLDPGPADDPLDDPLLPPESIPHPVGSTSAAQ